MRAPLFIALLLWCLAAVAAPAVQDDRAPAAGIQGQNIFEVKPDASSQPGYMEQDNAARNAVQPGNNSPFWRAVAGGLEGSTALPAAQAPEAGVLIQRQVQYPGSRLTTAGQAWRQVRNQWLIPYGGALILIVLGGIGIFYLARGPVGHHAAHEGGARIERFTLFERSAHWANAIAFCVLAASGLVIAFGKFLLLPLLGPTLFGGLTYALKTVHNIAGPLFAVSLVIVFLTFLRDNRPQRGDLRWLLRGGGFFSRGAVEPPSHRFNAGEKLVFWIGVFVLGGAVVASGLVLEGLVPRVGTDRGTMQVANMVHVAGAVLMVCAFAAHIYIGTVGMRGAYSAMRHGWVGEPWALEHHAHWLASIKAGKIPAQRSGSAPQRRERSRPVGSL